MIGWLFIIGIVVLVITNIKAENDFQLYWFGGPYKETVYRGK